jgi:hypothetical protein
MNVKTSELTGAALDWAVEECLLIRALDKVWVIADHDQGIVHAKGCSTDWLWVGPIIESCNISLNRKHDGWWVACIQYNYADEPTHTQLAKSPLEAAARCFVASKLGDVVDIPGALV